MWRKMMGDKVVCERWCGEGWCVTTLTKWCVKDGSVTVCERWCVKGGV